MSTWLLLFALLPSRAAAGDLVLESRVAMELYAGTALLARTWGPARLQIQELEPGLKTLKVVRGERSDLVDVQVPDGGAISLAVDDAQISSAPAAPAAVGPTLELRAALGQRFGVILDGKRVAVIGHTAPVRVLDVEAGTHHLELRTADLTVVWARGDLDLVPDDLLVVTGQEGYAPLVSGREGAFRLAGAATQRSASEPSATVPEAPALPDAAGSGG